ncbi:MAG: aldo/keto reductase, partial [Anaerolineales bacterium]|nr:aldo/keto reductase [Anaerolineales bacterium]
MADRKLNTRRLGKSDFQVTEIGIGLWAIGGSEWGPVDDQNSLDTIEAALKSGITFFDTAD